jgi:allantoate deiminase
LEFGWKIINENDAVQCSKSLTQLLIQACNNLSIPNARLHSGAGHDAAVMATITDVAMLFVRNREGISHHPDESVKVEDIAVAISVMEEFIGLVAKRENRSRPRARARQRPRPRRR